MSKNLWWIRRDLRLMDNQAMQAALTEGEAIIPVFILDPTLLSSANAGENRVAFLMAGLRELDRALRGRGSYLVVRQGSVLEQLEALLEETKATAVYAEEDVSPYARRRDAIVSQHLPLKLVAGVTVHHPELVYKTDGSPYTIYTPFSRRWKELLAPEPGSLLPTPERLPTPPDISSLPIPEWPHLSKSLPFPPGEQEAQRRLNAFMQEDGEASIARYADRRDRLDLDGTSGLSPYLRFGMLSARQAVVSAMQKRSAVTDERGRQGAEVWLNELIWREFYMSILYHFPQVLKQSFRPAYDRIAWQRNEEHFAAWRGGQTGYPVVDAAMRQLAQRGWMHNRARMIVASFLVKDLLIDWRWGERWFMQYLVDGDPAANNGGWQWAAGTGTDAAPYFRIFNPVLQGKKFDPNGNYVRHWLPELERVPKQYVHEPWKMPDDFQRKVKCVIGHDYPQPIVDHSIARRATLDAYARAREENASGGNNGK
ncbi:MAG TPA: deoxyribodipyrimidine photo-lyase [Anaerolineae bacterium]|jgi:deoxyribodipyrimidine photo-lyase|nr:deoxyribodipyrimidine photo-lyase [Anaerolineae bacterium]